MATMEDATVLVVDDEDAVREMYAETLAGGVGEVRTAADGETALTRLDGVDVVLLDRRMPGQSGAEVLERIRAAGHDCRVAMVTAVEPGEDIATMPFDTYLNKPAALADLRGTVERLLALDEYESALAEQFRVTRKLGALEATKEESELAESEAYARLRTRREELAESMERAATEVEPDLIRGVIEESDGTEE